MKTIFLTLCLLISYAGFSQVNEVKPISKIEKVTVFPSAAQVYRTANVSLQKGKNSIVLQNLSPYIIKNSVQVNIKGNLTILSINMQENKLKEQEQIKEIKQLKNEVEAFEDQKEIELNKLLVLAKGKEVLNANIMVSGANTAISMPILKENLEYQKAQYAQMMEQEFKINKTIAKIADTIAKLNSQFETILQAEPSTSDIIIDVLAKENITGTISFDYVVSNAGWFPTYDIRVENLNEPMAILHKANVHQKTGEDWKSVKLMLTNNNPNENNISPKLNPIYLADGVFNSYANSNNNLIREISGRVKNEDGEGMPFVAVNADNTTVATMTDYNGYYTMKVPIGANTLKFSCVGYNTQEQTINGTQMDLSLVPIERNLSTITIQKGLTGDEIRSLPTRSVNDLAAKSNGAFQSDAGGAVSFRGARGDGKSYYINGMKVSDKPSQINTYSWTNLPEVNLKANVNFNYEITELYTIVSDGKSYTVDIKQDIVPAVYQHFAIPKLNKNVFVNAIVTNLEDYQLLEAEANIYYEGTYLGKSLISLSNIEDSLIISLGIDKGVSVSRVLEKNNSKKVVLSDKRVCEQTFAIAIKNNKNNIINLVLEDQVPVSNDKEITVDKAVHDGAEANVNTGVLRWDMKLNPLESKTIKNSYSIKYPKNYSIQKD